MKRRWLVVASLVTVLALIAAACGDDTASTTTTTAAATTTTAAATTTTAAPTTTVPPEPTVTYDTGVTPAPCAEAVNSGNGCIYVGVISDLSDGPFHAVAIPLTQAQKDFWDTVNAAGGIDGFDVIINQENTFDAHYDGPKTVEGYQDMRGRVAALAQILGTPQTQAAFADLVADDTVAMPATWWSGWAFAEGDFGNWQGDHGLILESGAPYCFEAMNAMDFAFSADGLGLATDVPWAVVAFPSDYGGDYGAGAVYAGAQLGLTNDPLMISQLPDAYGPDYAAVVGQLVGAQVKLILFVTGPTEMANIIGGLAQASYLDFKAIGASPTWNLGLQATPVYPVLSAVYFQSAPWGGWTTDTPGHAAMRAAAEASGTDPNGGYVAGWVWQYPLLALLKEAVAAGDLTHANLAALAGALENVDYQDMLATRSFAGDPNDTAVRSTIINRLDNTSPDGVVAAAAAFTSEVAAGYPFTEPCFVP